MVNKVYLENFESRITEELLRLCKQYGILDGTLLATDDIDSRWNELAPEYMADAVPNIADYPTVAIAWAGYIGMAVAHQWDSDWTTHCKDEYKSYYGGQGFDDMDEHIVHDVIGFHLESKEARNIEDMMRRLGETALTLIRRERIEPQSPMAFHVYARVVKVMFRIGAAVELKRLGYKFEQVNIPNMGGGMATC
ncbi:MAG: hypothetical protein J6V20_02405 [Bacteroidaceae bacterium]|nr:hypothetical protein [Bacteroidaceae bacterium]